jgi:hypothetical protein
MTNQNTSTVEVVTYDRDGNPIIIVVAAPPTQSMSET